jgi:hypothetical protein
MKFPDIPGPPGRTPYEKFIDVVRHVISVPKKEIDRREEEYKRQRKRVKNSKRHA